MELHPVLKELDFVPDPMWFQRQDGNYVAFCEEHAWSYVSSLEKIVRSMLLDHVGTQHAN